MSSRKRSNSVSSEQATHSEAAAASPRRRVVRRTQHQNSEGTSDGSDSEQETRRSRLKKKSSQKRASNPNQKTNSKSKPNVPSHIKIGKSIFFEQQSCASLLDDDKEQFEYLDSSCICDQKMKEQYGKTSMSFLILQNRIGRFKKQQQIKRIENKDDEQILLEIIEKEGLYTKKEIEQIGQKTVNFEKSCDPSLTQEERLPIIKRLKEQHELYRRLEKRDRKHQIYQLRCVIPHVSNEEALYALKLTNNIEEEAIIKLTDYTFFQQIRKEIALEYNPNPSLTVDHLVPLADKWNYEQDQLLPDSPSSSASDQHETVAQPSTSTSFVQPTVELSRSTKRSDDMSDDEEEEDDKDDDDFVIKERRKPANKTKAKPKKASTSRKNSKKSKQEEEDSQSDCEIEEEEDEDEEISEIDEKIEEDDSKKKKRKRKASTSINSSRLLLDDALSDVIKKDGWSKARIEAYEKINTNPNAYYYRFNEPGESQKNGKWSQKEKELFIKKLKEYIEDTDNFQWGLFSKRIPGRVGYQCSNFYRTLLKTGDVKVDLVEECKNKGGSGSNSGAKSSSSNSGANSTSKKRKKPATPTRTKSKKKKVEPSDDEDSNQNDSESVSSRSSCNNSKSDSESSEESSSDDSLETNSRNILEDFIDPITQEQVQDPAISPYGHVLGYQTWLKVLNTEPKNTCPYTKQTLTKRNLVKLNFDNVEEFKSKIRNFD